MSFIYIDAQTTNKAFITTNGVYRLTLGRPANAFQVTWTATEVNPGGILTFSVDGDLGEDNNPIDLSTTGQPGSRTRKTNMHLWTVDVEVTNLPMGGSFLLSCGG